MYHTIIKTKQNVYELPCVTYWGRNEVITKRNKEMMHAHRFLKMFQNKNFLGYGICILHIMQTVIQKKIASTVYNGK